MYANLILGYLIKNYEFTTVLDVGSGAGEQAKYFLDAGKNVTCIDYGNSVYFKEYPSKLNLILCDFNSYETSSQFDLLWCSHILEHQRNVGLFINKCYSLTNDNGILCITVPPLKNNIVGGHLTLWNPGLLLYNLIINGIDCSEAVCFKHGYNISVVVRKKPKIDLTILDLSYDKGDIEKLSKFFPCRVYQGFDGNSVVSNKFHGNI